MLKNWLLTAWQQLARQKLLATINIVGLAVGLTVFILVFMFVEKELSWDRHWENADQIYWLTHEFRFNESSGFTNTESPYPAMNMIRENFPEAISVSSRLVNRGEYLVHGDNRFRGGITLAERGFPDIFNLEIISGSLEETFAVPGRLAIPEDDVARFFGTEDPLGKIMTLEAGGGEVDYQVSAVFRKPEDSSVYFSALSLLEESVMPELAGRFTDWSRPVQARHFFLLDPSFDVPAMNRRMESLVNTSMPKEPWRTLGPGEQMGDFHTFEFQWLPDAHFDESLRLENSGDKGKILAFAITGFLVLAMGSTNFVILATANAENRKKEIGIRKMLGATRYQLLYQYLGESLLVTLIALLLALVLAMSFLPGFNALIDQPLAFNIFSARTLVLLLGLALSVGIVGGLYPGFVLSSCSPATVLQPVSNRMFGLTVGIRNALACFQFAIAIVLMVATLVLYLQLQHLRQLDLGFSTENIFILQLNDQGVRDNLTPLLNELNNVVGIESQANSSLSPEGRLANMSVGEFRNESTGMEADFEGIWVDYGFFDLYGMELLAGRFFDRNLDVPAGAVLDAEEGNAAEAQRQGDRMVINRRMSESLGFESPADAAGSLVYTENIGPDGEPDRRAAEIIGVVENSKFWSLRNPPGNEIYSLGEENVTAIALKYLPAARDTIRDDIERIWNTVSDDNVFLGGFLDQLILAAYDQEAREGRLLTALSLLSVMIACLGLFALSSLTIKRSVKEIGVRKVLGASSRRILLLFLWRFSIPVLVANIVAWPVAIFIMLQWLQRFNDQINYLLLVPVCLLVTLISLLIAWATVIATTTRAAQANPVKSLRYE